MSPSGMIRVDPSHFSNAIVAVQRTGSLTGGAVRGLPNGVVIDGLKGINSFASGIAEAQKEFQLGRTQKALERIRQIEMQFNGIVGRWDSTARSLITNAKQGRQQLPLQKLNEVKNAQSRMQQLTGPASKAFRDLVTALEHEIAMEGHDSSDTPAEDAEMSEAISDDSADPNQAADAREPTALSDDEPPRGDVLGSFAATHRCGPRLRLQKRDDQKSHIVPKLEKNKYYLAAGFDPPRVIQVKELQRKAVLVFDPRRSRQSKIEGQQLSALIKRGIWVLVQRTESQAEQHERGS